MEPKAQCLHSTGLNARPPCRRCRPGYGTVDSPVFSLTGETLDYTDLIASPSPWATTEQLHELARAAQLVADETIWFVEAPDDFLQSPCRGCDDLHWIEHPVMAFKLDTVWREYVESRLRATVRSAAIASVFADSRIRDQAGIF